MFLFGWKKHEQEQFAGLMLLQPPSKKGAFFLPSKDSLGTTHTLFEVSMFLCLRIQNQTFPAANVMSLSYQAFAVDTVA